MIFCGNLSSFVGMMLSGIRCGAVAGVVEIKGGVVSGVINLESPGVEVPGWRPRHEERYHAFDVCAAWSRDGRLSFRRFGSALSHEPCLTSSVSWDTPLRVTADGIGRNQKINPVQS